MDIEEKSALIKKKTHEVLVEDDLNWMLETGIPLKHYIGFEISGKIHLGTGLQCMSKVRDLQKAGVKCSIFLADWHSWINDKLGGDIEVIKKIGVSYFKEGLKASLKCVGGDPDKIKFVLGSDLYHNNDKYWQTFIDVSKQTTLGRIQRSITIMGRKEGESVDFAKLVYPPMQVADIFIQEVNIAHAGIDQRKAHVIAREVALKLKTNPLEYNKKKYKPIAIHHHLLLGLQQPPTWPIAKETFPEVMSAMKMSKSQPDSAVFITDSPEEIQKKVRKAFCPEKEIIYNPVLDWAKNLILEEGSVLEIKRPSKFGGDVSFEKYEKLEKIFEKGELHPMDLKQAVADFLVKKLEPIRKHFENPKIKNMKEELEKLAITR